ncbi:MAG: hypothetical protein ABI615_10260 [Chthoniobacterales bacterium]
MLPSLALLATGIGLFFRKAWAWKSGSMIIFVGYIACIVFLLRQMHSTVWVTYLEVFIAVGILTLVYNSLWSRQNNACFIPPAKTDEIKSGR